MRLAEKYCPVSLEDVVAQGPVRVLRNFARDPYSTCFLLEGPPGIGKTSAAMALAHDLGCHEGPWGGLITTCCSELGVNESREMLRQLSFRPGTSSGFVVWLMEEMDYLSSQCQTFLKDALEKRLPRHAIVIACTNDSGKIGRALRDRFTPLFFSGGETFREGAEERLRDIWESEMGLLPDSARMPFPQMVVDMAIADDQTFSMRRAMDLMQRHMLSAIDLDAVVGKAVTA